MTQGSKGSGGRGASRPKRIKSLVVTSHGTPSGAATPVLAALEAAGHRVRAIDVGRVGARHSGAVERVMKAISAEFAERRLARELASESPDVAIAFDPGSTAALLELRRHSASPVAVIGVISELSPDPAWASVNADRFLAVDSFAAVTLSDAGAPEDRIMTVGPITTLAFAAAGKQKREVLRARFKLPITERVVLASVAGLGHEVTSQLALQLSLIDAPMTFLFAAEDDAEAASALRRQVPALSLRAKLFGNTKDAALLWRCADVVIAKPHAHIAQQVLAINTKMVAFLAEDSAGERLAADLGDRGMGAAAANALLVSSALEALLNDGHQPSSRTGADGAANVADIATIVAGDKAAVVAASAHVFSASTGASAGPSDSAAASASAAPPGDLEDLSSGGLEDLLEMNLGGGGPAGEKSRRLAALRSKMDQLAKSVGVAQEAAEQWDAKKTAAERGGDHQKAKEAARNAASERAKTQKALTDMSKLEADLRKLEGRQKSASSQRQAARAHPGSRTGPRVSDMLDDIKERDAASVDDELAALKKKMTGKGRRK